MKTVVVAVLKGGAGKSTLTAALAVRASRDGARVAMIDLNHDQDTLGHWWTSRGEPDSPKLVEDFDDFAAEHQRLATAGVAWLAVDTPPGAHDGLTEAAIARADVVLVPVRPSAFDLAATAETVEMCRKWRKSFAVCLNAADTRQKFAPGVKATEAIIAERGWPLLAARISYDHPWINAAFKGRTGAEISKSCAAELEALWAEVQGLIGDGVDG